jgi:hypothetical protein
VNNEVIFNEAVDSLRPHMIELADPEVVKLLKEKIDVPVSGTYQQIFNTCQARIEAFLRTECPIFTLTIEGVVWERKTPAETEEREESERLTKARLAEVTAMVRKMIAPERQYCRVYYQHNLPVALVLSDLVIVNDPQSKGVNSILPMGTHDGADKFVAATFPDACPYNVPPESLNELLFGLHSDRWLLASAPVIKDDETTENPQMCENPEKIWIGGLTLYLSSTHPEKF